jgi:carbamoyl-phosphate synthase large subunit
MINIAILSASREVTLIKHFRKILSSHGGGNVFSLDVESNRPAMLFSDKSIICPYTNSEEYESFIIKFCIDNKIKLIFSCRDEDLIELSKIKHKLKSIGTIAMVANSDVIKICNDKYLFNKFCIENNFNIPKVYESHMDIKFPVFLKPKIGKGSLNTFKVKNKKILNFILENFEEDFIIQKYIDKKEYTIDLFSDFNGNVISVVPRERILTVGGESYIGQTFKNKLIIDESIRLSKKLNLIGHNTLQCFSDGDIVEWIEVNPRFGGGANLGFESGHMTPEYLVLLLKGDILKPKINEFEDGLQMLRYTNDIFIPSNPKLIKDKIFCIDIDGTICTQNVKYEDVKPIYKGINKINKLYDNNEIILFTSRGYYSGVSWLDLLETHLKEWGVKYHKLMQGKPYADYYIDNKAINILEWI